MQNLKPQIHIMFRKAIMMGPSKADQLRTRGNRIHVSHRAVSKWKSPIAVHGGIVKLFSEMH